MFDNLKSNPFMMASQDGMIDIENNSGTIDIDFSQGQEFNNNMNFGIGTTSSPIIEPVQEKVVNRTIVHNVPHICPVRTRIVNHHVFKHTYQPEFSCCEENVCSEVQCGSCCNY